MYHKLRRAPARPPAPPVSPPHINPPDLMPTSSVGADVAPCPNAFAPCQPSPVPTLSTQAKACSPACCSVRGKCSLKLEHPRESTAALCGENEIRSRWGLKDAYHIVIHRDRVGQGAHDRRHPTAQLVGPGSGGTVCLVHGLCRAVTPSQPKMHTCNALCTTE